MKRIFFCLIAMVVAVSGRAQSLTLPENATVEDDWTCSFVMHSTSGDETVSEVMKVAFSGEDVYFFLPNPIAGNTWVKGTVDGGTATFAKGQYLGNYNGAVYMVGQDAEGICDVVFGYNADEHLFTLGDMQIVLSSSATSIDAWAYYTGMTVSKGGAVAEGEWTFTYTMHYYDSSSQEQTDGGSEPVEVVINGSEVAINFPNPLNGAAWVKGTINGTQAVFPQGQQMGTYGGQPFYLVGLGESGLCDVVFNYDSANNVFTLADMYVLMNGSTTKSDPWCYFSQVTIAKGSAVVEEEETAVELPEGLTQQRYSFEAREIVYNTDGTIAQMNYVARPVQVAFSGNTEVYVQGLCDFLPEAWVKGTVDDDEITFEKGQFMGKMLGYSVYLTGKSYGELSDITFRYSNGELLQGGYVIFNSSKTTENPFSVYAGANIKKFVEKAATPAAPRMEYYNFSASEGYAPLVFDLPLTSADGKTALAAEKLGYSIYTEKGGQQTVYTFTKSIYADLPEASMTVIPYTYDSNYNFVKGVVFINENLDSNDRIGIQSVYTGGGATNCSEIVWQTLSSSGIRQATDAAVVGEYFTDLQGRRVDAMARGLIIKTQRLADGTLRTVKVMR